MIYFNIGIRCNWMIIDDYNMQKINDEYILTADQNESIIS